MSIADWPESERPREKLLNLGPKALSDAELLAIFLRIGCAGKSAVDLARELLQQYGGLRPLLESSQTEFCEISSSKLALTERRANRDLGFAFIIHSFIDSQSLPYRLTKINFNDSGIDSFVRTNCTHIPTSDLSVRFRPKADISHFIFPLR